MIPCSTAEHLHFYIFNLCQIYKIDLLLKESILTGKATNFLGIDIVIMDKRDAIIEKLNQDISEKLCLIRQNIQRVF